MIVKDSMKYKHHFVVIYFLITTIACNAMENTTKTKLDVIEEITTVKDLHCVQYLTGNRVAIGQVCGITHIIDLKTKKTQPLTDFRNITGYFGIQSDGKKIVTSVGQKITVYDEKTGKEEWIVTEAEEFGGFAFNSCKNLIFLNGDNKIIMHNYVTNKREKVDIPLAYGDFYSLMALHPKQDILCTMNKHNISLYKLDNLILSFKTVSLPQSSYGYKCCHYSCDGTYIAVRNIDTIIIVNPNKDDDIQPIKLEVGDGVLTKILFHPGGVNLAALCRRGLNLPYVQWSVCFWDIKTQKLIWKTPELYIDDCLDFSFSDDGYEMIIAFKSKCIRMLVPFAIKEKCLFLLHILNQCKVNECVLPRDIIFYIGNILIDTYKNTFS
jgi:hypothetical protein